MRAESIAEVARVSNAGFGQNSVEKDLEEYIDWVKAPVQSTGLPSHSDSHLLVKLQFLEMARVLTRIFLLSLLGIPCIAQTG